jgi:hypothetical protein
LAEVKVSLLDEKMADLRDAWKAALTVEQMADLSETDSNKSFQQVTYSHFDKIIEL